MSMSSVWSVGSEIRRRVWGRERMRRAAAGPAKAPEPPEAPEAMETAERCVKVRLVERRSGSALRSEPVLETGVRMDRVAAARERLADGFYDDSAVLDAAVERMLREIGG